MNVGFTGTRRGLSKAQREQLIEVLRYLFGRPLDRTDPNYAARPSFRHGDAEGADREAASLAKETGYRLVPYPAGADPLLRNRAIVLVCDILIAAPATDREVLRSGTWTTVRFARNQGKPIVMLSRGKELKP